MKIRSTVVTSVAALFVLGACSGGVSSDDVTAQEPEATTQAPQEPQATPEPVSEPTKEPEPAPEPEPTPEPVPEGAVYSGTGTQVVTLEQDTANEAFIATITHEGQSNFIVESVDENGQTIDLLANSIGNYSGTVALSLDSAPTALAVQADGLWSVEVLHLSRAPRWDGTGTYEASGSGFVIIEEDILDGMATLGFEASGEGHVGMWVYGEAMSYPDLKVNEIGPYAADLIIPGDTFLLEVLAEGSWSLTLR